MGFLNPVNFLFNNIELRVAKSKSLPFKSASWENALSIFEHFISSPSTFSIRMIKGRIPYHVVYKPRQHRLFLISPRAKSLFNFVPEPQKLYLGTWSSNRNISIKSLISPETFITRSVNIEKNLIIYLIPLGYSINCTSLSFKNLRLTPSSYCDVNCVRYLLILVHLCN